MCVYIPTGQQGKKEQQKKKWAKFRNYTEEEMEKADKHEELQIKTMMRYYFIPVRRLKEKTVLPRVEGW